MRITDTKTLNQAKDRGLKKFLPSHPRITVGMGTCGIGNSADEIYKVFETGLNKRNKDILLARVGCFGFCAEEPLVNVYMPGNPVLILNRFSLKNVPDVINGIDTGRIPSKMILARIEEWDHLTSKITYGKGYDGIPHWHSIPFFKGQKKIVLRNCGLINPEDIEEYIAVGGYHALCKTLMEITGDAVIKTIKDSKLRGRGGAGFPTGIKWEIMKNSASDKKYIICNADEGDPGAYMNRNEIESDPHMLLEGMTIGAFAMGADEGIIYVRAEYPLAVQRLKTAINQSREYGLLGKNIFDKGFDFDIRIVEGAGAFVCGEETSLIESIEGNPGRPRPRPPFPAQKGLYGKPTNINNVETWCNVPVIIEKGAEWFRSTGTETSAGTKVFSLVGKVKNTGLVELPLGTTLKTVIYEIGDGSENNRRIKAVQTGGPSGGCLSEKYFDTPIDYESLASLGSIMGSGGMVVMDEDNCMVDVAKFFLEFTTAESCGKCVPCREGLYQSLKAISAITEGKTPEINLQELENLGRVIKDTALCGLGQTGPNPVLTTLKYFKDEYEEHIAEKRCRAGVCQNLFLSPCENSCPVHLNIPGFLELYKENRIEESFEFILQYNPLPATTGRVCHYPCELKCRRVDYDDPISQREVHRYIADKIYSEGKDREVLKRLQEEKLPSTSKKIAIVGAGPAGLTAAFYLTRLGHEVTIYEAHSYAGGMLWLIPDFRLPKNVLEKEIQLIKKLGTKFVFNTKIGRDKTIVQLEKEVDDIFVGTGAGSEIKLGIPGEDLDGVLSGIKYLQDRANGEKVPIGKKVVVIGGGNVAIDAARTVIRVRSEVTVLYRREITDMPANKEEIKDAREEGVRFIFLVAPKKIISNGKGKVKEIELTRMVPGEYDSSGRRRPIETESSITLPCDTVMVAVGEKIDSEFLKDSGVKVRSNGSIEINKFTMETCNSKIFAGGDNVTGPNTVTDAMASGKKAALNIDRKLMGKNRENSLFKKYAYRNILSVEPEGGKRQHCRKLLSENRKNNFREVSLGLSKEKARIEAIRCLRCDVKETGKQLWKTNS